MSQDEGHVELELSDDPYDVQKLDVSQAPCVVTLNKVCSKAGTINPYPAEKINLTTPISDCPLIRLLEIMYSFNSQTA